MNVVLYGDSNTYGYDPLNGRYENRYSNILKRYFNNRLNIFEEGLIGRTTIYDDYRPNRKSIDDIYETIFKYNKIDLFIIMLGTNDLKINNANNIDELKNGMNILLNKIIKANNINKILLISPILLAKNIENLDQEFNYNSYLLSKKLSTIYKELALKNNLLFFDAKLIAKPGIDGEHINEEGHLALGNTLAKIIENILFNEV